MQIATEIASFTCICCPLGCSLEVSFDAEGGIAAVEGNVCARGADYAASEATSPQRMVTSVVCVKGCLEPLSVKTASPVPKQCVQDVLDVCASLCLAVPIAAHEVVIADVCGTGVDVVATKSLP